MVLIFKSERESHFTFRFDDDFIHDSTCTNIYNLTNSLINFISYLIADNNKHNNINNIDNSYKNG